MALVGEPLVVNPLKYLVSESAKRLHRKLIFNKSYILQIYILMNFSFWFDTINLGWSTVYI